MGKIFSIKNNKDICYCSCGKIVYAESCYFCEEEEDRVYVVGGDAYCELCFNEFYFHCSACGNAVSSDECYYVVEGDIFCSCCGANYYR